MSTSTNMNTEKEISWNTKENKQLIEAFLVLKNKDDARRFLRDLMTEKEIKEFSNRLEAANLLTANTSYTLIVKKTGLSSTTIARISKWLNGPLDGYRLVLNRLHHPYSQKSVERGLPLH